MACDYEDILSRGVSSLFKNENVLDENEGPHKIHAKPFYDNDDVN